MYAFYRVSENRILKVYEQGDDYQCIFESYEFWFSICRSQGVNIVNQTFEN